VKSVLICRNFWRARAWDLMTTQFASLLARAEENFLVDLVLAGIPQSTKTVPGKQTLTIDELRYPPRLPDSDLIENGLYINVVEIGSNLLEWKLYVGSGTKTLGVIARWQSYLTKWYDRSDHAKEITKPGRIIDLRCIAHYSVEPEFWLTTFAKSIFMLYLGTVRDARFGDYSSAFTFDDLYKEINEIESACGRS
jgi:hypothetical protein